MLASRRARETARIARFGWLAARAYPDASFEGLCLASAWASWLFLRDDHVDQRATRASAAALRASGARLSTILAGGCGPAADDPFETSLQRLREDVLAHGGGAWMPRFLNDVQEYFEACAWEAENRQSGNAPALEHYVQMRDLTGAVRTCFDIYELILGPPLRIEDRLRDDVQRLMMLANRMICWSNDVFSYEKELREGDCHNLVILLHRSGMTLSEAVARAGAMHDALVADFVDVEVRITRDAATQESTRRFVEALKGWVRANLDWSIETGRYDVARLDASAT